MCLRRIVSTEQPGHMCAKACVQTRMTPPACEKKHDRTSFNSLCVSSISCWPLKFHLDDKQPEFIQMTKFEWTSFSSFLLFPLWLILFHLIAKYRGLDPKPDRAAVWILCLNNILFTSVLSSCFPNTCYFLILISFSLPRATMLSWITLSLATLSPHP